MVCCILLLEDQIWQMYMSSVKFWLVQSDMQTLSSPSSPDAGMLISIVMLILFPVLQSHWPLPLHLGGPFLNLLGYSWPGCRQASSLVWTKWLSSYMLYPPVILTSLGFLQSRGSPLDSCTPPGLTFVKLSRPKTNWSLTAVELSISTGTRAAKESLKWQFCLPAKTGQLVRKEQCWQTAEVAVEFFWKLCYVTELSWKGNVTVRVGWLLAKNRVTEEITLDTLEHSSDTACVSWLLKSVTDNVRMLV